MDSEDEWAEENGEDLEKKQADEDEDDEMAGNDSDQDEGFIVSDGHLSVSEYDFSQDDNDAQKQEEIRLRRERLRQQQKQTPSSIADGKSYTIFYPSLITIKAANQPCVSD
jgi:hypothetical protein